MRMFQLRVLTSWRPFTASTYTARQRPGETNHVGSSSVNVQSAEMRISKAENPAARLFVDFLPRFENTLLVSLSTFVHLLESRVKFFLLFMSVHHRLGRLSSRPRSRRFGICVQPTHLDHGGHVAALRASVPCVACWL